MQKYLLTTILSLLFLGLSFSEEKKGENFDISKLVLGHIKDAHDFHILDYKGHSLSLPLPVILYTNKGFVCFLSSEFHHDDHAYYKIEKKGQNFVKFNEKIYYSSDTLNENNQYLAFDLKKKILNARPIDFSITKNVFSMFLSVIILVLLFFSISKMYKNIGAKKKPIGLGSFFEPLIVFIIDDIIKMNIGEKRYLKYAPFLLTLFFFIWINNMIGLIPFFPFSSNLTGNISFTFVLAAISLLVIIFSGNKNYWTHIFMPPGVPLLLLPIMIPIELIGIITKPFSMMIRLFANITAGHIVILSLISLIFLLKTLLVSPVSVAFVLFMNVLELLVAFIQAYIFTMLASMFIGQSVEESNH